MRYIRQVHMDDQGESNEHISQVKSSSSTTGALTTDSREQVASNIDNGRESYRSHNDRTGDEARVEINTSGRGTRYIRTVGDGRETNNLLSLPRF